MNRWELRAKAAHVLDVELDDIKSYTECKKTLVLNDTVHLSMQGVTVGGVLYAVLRDSDEI